MAGLEALLNGVLRMTVIVSGDFDECITSVEYTFHVNFAVSIQFNSLFQTHLRSISHNYMSQHNRKMQKQHINDSLA